MVVAPIANPNGGSVRRRAPRLAGDARRSQIVQAACEFFARSGFTGPTRDLAASIGVTQALLYRYFDSKADLIDAVFGEVFRNHWSLGALERFQETAGEPMVDRLTKTYEHMLPRVTRNATQLLFRAGLDDQAGPIYRSAGKSWPLWIAFLGEWRREEGLPPLSAAPMLEGERSLLLSFHNAMIMIRVREHVFHVPRTLDDADEIRQIAETHDVGVRAVLRKLHAGGASPTRMAPIDDKTLEAA